MSAHGRMPGNRRNVRPGWSAWIRLDTRLQAYDALELKLPREFGCYELAIAKGQEAPWPVYVGRAGEKDRGPRNRINEHARAVTGDCRFYKKVLAVRRKRFNMYVSYRITTRGGAKFLEKQCLEDWWRYHWNTVRTPWGRA